MPRPLVYGNGHFLLQLDRRHTIRDLFFPLIGQPNHLAGHPIRMGVWCEGQFSWLESDGWARAMEYEEGTMVGRVSLQNAQLGIDIQIVEAMDPIHPVFVREVSITNESDCEREIRLFQTQDLRIAESDIGDTALYHPAAKAMVHYKSDYAFLFGASRMDQTTTAIKAFGDQVGSWLDAEDGWLNSNPISQGSVDSTFGVHFTLAGHAQDHWRTWIIAGHEIEQVVSRQSEWMTANRVEYSRQYWRSWSSAPVNDEFDDFYRRSLMLVRSQIDQNGAILAANDSDIMATNRATYSFVWPRDGALVAAVLDAAGHSDITRCYYEFCEPLLPPSRAFFLHKYGPDGKLGASWHPFEADGAFEVPFQEDETALMVWSLHEHYEHVGDLERVARWYPRMVRETCDAMVAHRDAHGLPLPSWDLWEERRGVHAYTCATVIAGLRAGAALADRLGDADRADAWRSAAAQTLDAALDNLFDASRGVFHRMLNPSGEPDLTIDSATLAFGLFGCLSVDHPAIVANANTVERALRVHGATGGIARYQGDYYFRRSNDYPGNPWVICTMWLAQTRLLQAKSLAEIEDAMDAVRWASKISESTGVLAEQFHPDSGEPLSVSPLTWSHAEVARTIQWYRRRKEELSSTL